MKSHVHRFAQDERLAFLYQIKVTLTHSHKTRE
uniref:Uncharacterized protein n=1 Tax=Rhizophora mucronata TaxID=61149 RepID=A0A2P2NKE8_RHIMU